MMIKRFNEMLSGEDTYKCQADNKQWVLKRSKKEM